MAETPRTTLPDARERPRFTGIATFGRFPFIDVVEREHQPVDWAIYGVPYDGGVTYRPGARFGPRAVREQSQYLKPASIARGINIVQQYSLADAGDAPIRPFDCKETLDAVCDFARDVGDTGHTRLLAVGGDHSIAYANIRATWERRGQPAAGLALLHFDAHLDTVDVIWGEKWNHGTVFRRAIEDGLIDPARMVSVGIRGPLNTLTDLEYGRDQGVTIITADDWLFGDGQAQLQESIDQLGDAETYLTFDIDCVDPAFAPGTGTPCCGGFSSAEVLRMLRSIEGVNLVGADVVEVLPDRDAAGITAMLASQVIFETLACAAAYDRKAGR